jgi:hypothetical protein
MSYTAKDVQSLRQSTGAGMMDCKKALEENAGDVEAAKQWLREKGLAASAKRDDRDNAQGVVALIVEANRAAIVKLKSAVQRESGVEIICEEFPVGEPKSLGSISVQIQVLQGEARTLRDATEARYKIMMQGDNPMIPWMVLHATGILNRFRVGSDGTTAYQRVNRQEVHPSDG